VCEELFLFGVTSGFFLKWIDSVVFAKFIFLKDLYNYVNGDFVPYRGELHNLNIITAKVKDGLFLTRSMDELPKNAKVLDDKNHNS
jgi:hypothetical protein